MMKTYLPQKTPEYSDVTLVLPSHSKIDQTGGLNQFQYKPDGGAVYTVTLGTVPEYFVTLQWKHIEDLDKQFVEDYYFNPLKGKGMARTFGWKHPIEETVYVVRFTGNVQETLHPTGRFSLPSIKLKVEGYV